ncbi:ferredoxin [Lentibacter sp.]|uniref:ferredoxin n=1 Tax=Lentibacter sp. TaxID=2024994 RepID=UPI003F6C6883
MAALRQALKPAPEAQALAVFGALHETGDTIILLGPHEPGFWAHFSASPEYRDGLADPLDRYSKRAIGLLAAAWGGTAVFPSDGPPFAPFMAWAMASGQAWQSPVGMLVHASAGLMVSYRGAVRLRGELDLAAPAARPCDTCVEKPCLTACPVSALNESQRYDVALCKSHISTADGEICMSAGCLTRRACPVSARYGRRPAQSAFHMKSFL